MATIFARLSALVLFSVASVASAFEQTVYYQNDAFGSPVVATDVSGNVLWKETYQPFGGRTRNQDQGTNEVWFHAKPVDDETGLSYFGARYYDSAVGRFMGIDPAGFDESNVQSFNKYAYGNNNPFRYRDANGKSVLDVGFLIYDVGKLAKVIHDGGDVPSALVDVGLSSAGVLIPIPFVGEGLKAARSAERLAVAAALAEHGVTTGRSLASEGKTVLGHFPEYKQLGDSLNARTFDIPEMVWNRMSEAERWAANQKFLDRMISRGDEIMLATPLDKVRPGSYFEKELQYLSSKGFVPNAEGTKLIKGPPASADE